MIQDRSAALLIRVWLEGDGKAFRSRLSTIDTSAGPDAGGEVTFAVGSTHGDVLNDVRHWLEELSGPAAEPD